VHAGMSDRMCDADAHSGSRDRTRHCATLREEWR
jgi:hypothetical protein